MTPDKIRITRELLEKKIVVTKSKLKGLESKLKGLQNSCSHPNLQTSHWIGYQEKGTDYYCPDCNYRNF